MEDYKAAITRNGEVLSYANGAEVLLGPRGKYKYIKYNTEDTIWFDDDGNITDVFTHDGLHCKY